MTTTTSIRPAPRRQSPETTDLILIGACATVWLVWLATSVAAIVALTDLSRGFDQPARGAHTGLLYVIIGVSALIVLAAVPMLMRARRTGGVAPVPDGGNDAASPQQARQRALRAESEPDGSGGRAEAGPAASAAASGKPGPSKQAAISSAVRARPDAAVTRIVLRGTVVLTAVIGAALTAVALATYLMAISEDSASWVSYGVAGIVTAAMPAVPLWYLRQLHRQLNG